MESLNHIQQFSKSTETPSPSSAFDSGPIDVEVTLVNPASESSDNDNNRLPDVVVESQMYGNDDEQQIQETYFSIAIQVFIPFLIAGFGMVFAGLVLDRIQVLSLELLIKQIRYVKFLALASI